MKKLFEFWASLRFNLSQLKIHINIFISPLGGFTIIIRLYILKLIVTTFTAS